MKYYALITVGFKKPTAAKMQDWLTWFDQLKPHIKNQIGFSRGFKVSENSIDELPLDINSLTGVIEIQVENEIKALELAKDCPATTETLVYEIRNPNN